MHEQRQDIAQLKEELCTAELKVQAQTDQRIVRQRKLQATAAAKAEQELHQRKIQETAAAKAEHDLQQAKHAQQHEMQGITKQVG